MYFFQFLLILLFAKLHTKIYNTLSRVQYTQTDTVRNGCLENADIEKADLEKRRPRNHRPRKS